MDLLLVGLQFMLRGLLYLLLFRTVLGWWGRTVLPEIFICLCLQTIYFLRCIPTTCWPQSFGFLFVAKIKNPGVFASRVKIKKHFTNTFFMFVKPFTTAPGPYKECDSPVQKLPPPFNLIQFSKRSGLKHPKTWGMSTLLVHTTVVILYNAERYSLFLTSRMQQK
jgi:hypothetical protein